MQNIVIYTKNWCGFCRAAKQLLDHMGLQYKEIDVTYDEDTYQQMVELAEGRTSVPQIFIDGKGIGGFTDLYAMVND